MAKCVIASCGEWRGDYGAHGSHYDFIDRGCSINKHNIISTHGEEKPLPQHCQSNTSEVENCRVGKHPKKIFNFSMETWWKLKPQRLLPSLLLLPACRLMLPLFVKRVKIIFYAIIVGSYGKIRPPPFADTHKHTRTHTKLFTAHIATLNILGMQQENKNKQSKSKTRLLVADRAATLKFQHFSTRICGAAQNIVKYPALSYQGTPKSVCNE